MKTVDLFYGEKNGFLVKEAFNALRTNIFFTGKNMKTIAFTSCEAHEGKTTVVMECCRSMAEVGKKVLLIDADMRKSPIRSRYAQEDDVMGLSQYLSGQASLEDVIYTAKEQGFDLIFAGPFPPDPTCLIDNEVFEGLIAEAREKYDYVLIDTPPLGLVIDAALVAVSCDGAILVIDQGKNHYRNTQKVKSQLEKSGCRILGAVLNETGLKSNKKKPIKVNYPNMTKKLEEMRHAADEKKASPTQSKTVASTRNTPEPNREVVGEVRDFEDILDKTGLKKAK